MALSIELNGKIIDIPGDDREIIKTVGNQIRQSGAKYTMNESRTRYKDYFVKSLQNECPICEHKTNQEDNYCGICGSKVAHLPTESEENLCNGD